jgi:aminopeptidase N
MLPSIAANELESKRKEIFLKDYKSPNYLIDEIELIFELDDAKTIVKSNMKVRHNRLSTHEPKNLILNGEELSLRSIKLDGKPLTENQYFLSDQQLIVHHVPDNFELEIIVEIEPQHNTSIKRHLLHTM